MADEYYAEPTLADVLQRNALDPKPSQWSWEVQKPLLKDFLLKALTLAPMGLRPGGMTPPRAIPRGSTDPGITGGSPGYSHGADQWSRHGIPANRHSSTGMSLYDWYGMRNARTGERLPNPYPNYRGNVDPVEAMTNDLAGRMESGQLGVPEAMAPYEQALAQQRAKQELLRALEGGRRAPYRPANDVE